jgi:ribosomal protein L12E/L44/L45/RPP1/RPP2
MHHKYIKAYIRYLTEVRPKDLLDPWEEEPEAEEGATLEKSQQAGEGDEDEESEEEEEEEES